MKENEMTPEEIQILVDAYYDQEDAKAIAEISKLIKRV